MNVKNLGFARNNSLPFARNQGEWRLRPARMGDALAASTLPALGSWFSALDFLGGFCALASAGGVPEKERQKYRIT